MLFNIDGTPVYWPDGTRAEIHQDHFRRESDRHAYVATLRIVRAGAPADVVTLRFTDEAYLRLPGATDSEKSRVVGLALAQYLPTLDLQEAFRIGVDCDVSGVHFYQR